MSETVHKGRPRWACELGDETWERINELLYEGWDTLDVMSELSLPETKLRSLQRYARKFGPRRRLQLFAKFKDALLSGGVELGPQFVQALTLIATKAVSPNVKDATQIRAGELMLLFARTLGKLVSSDEKEARDTDLRVQVSDKRETLSNEAIEKIKSIYGLSNGDGHDDS